MQTKPKQPARKWKDMSQGEKTGRLLILAAWPLVIYFGISMISNAAHNSTSTTSNEQTTASTQPEPTAAEKRQAAIDKYAPAYCRSHPKLHMSTKAFTGNSDGWPLFDGTRAWSAQECETIIGKLYDSGSNDDHLQTLADGKWAIGMTLKELIYAIGVPSDVNTTNYADYTRQQLIYGDPLYHATYIYVENGVVTSSQN